MIDDVLGLMVLAVVAGIIQAADHGRAFDPVTVLGIVGKSVAFLLAALVIGRWLSARAFGLASRLEGEGCCSRPRWCSASGSPGLRGSPASRRSSAPSPRGSCSTRCTTAISAPATAQHRSIGELLEPLSGFLVPVFFVLMGMRVDLRAFARVEVLGFAAVLTLVAVLGKQACSLGVLEKGLRPHRGGSGHDPARRGGAHLRQHRSDAHHRRRAGGDAAVIYSAVVMMVAITTLITPPVLTWRLSSRRVLAPLSARREPG